MLTILQKRDLTKFIIYAIEIVISETNNGSHDQKKTGMNKYLVEVKQIISKYQ